MAFLYLCVREWGVEYEAAIEKFEKVLTAYLEWEKSQDMSETTYVLADYSTGAITHVIGSWPEVRAKTAGVRGLTVRRARKREAIHGTVIKIADFEPRALEVSS